MRVIETSQLTKIYPLYSNPVHRLWEGILGKVYHENFTALSRVNIHVDKGECVGFIGMNGSGKSTLLQLLAGVLTPTSGTMSVLGNVAALLELGAGFHSDFTGIDNVRFHCSLIGLTPKEEKKRIEQIRDFAQIGEFFDRPVKTYSSGMFVRLAFATVIHMDPDILIVDEALAVGDIYFQVKCLDAIRAFKEKGKTMLFVSHDASAVKYLCDRAYLLHKGSIRDSGDPQTVFDHYNNLLGLDKNDPLPEKPISEIRSRDGNGKARILSAHLSTATQEKAEIITSQETFWLHVSYEIVEPIPNLTIGFSIRDVLGYEIFGINNYCLGQTISELEPGQYERSYEIKCLLGSKTYSVALALHPGDNHVGECYDWYNQAVVFRVSPTTDLRFVGACYLPTKLV